MNMVSNESLVIVITIHNENGCFLKHSIFYIFVFPFGYPGSQSWSPIRANDDSSLTSLRNSLFNGIKLTDVQ